MSGISVAMFPSVRKNWRSTHIAADFLLLDWSLTSLRSYRDNENKEHMINQKRKHEMGEQ